MLETVSGIDAKAAPPGALYTVPGGQTVVVTKVVWRVEAINALTVNPEVGIGIAAGESDIFAPQIMSGLTAVGDTWTFDATAKSVDASAAEVIKFGFDTFATATTLTLAADIFGYFVGTVPATGNLGDWTSFTPTGSWSTNTTYAGHYKQIGDDVHVRMRIDLAGAPDAAALTLGLPPGFFVDSGKLAGIGTFWPVGTARLNDTGTAVYVGLITYDDSAGALRVESIDAGGSSATATAVFETSPFTWASGDQVFAEFSVPVI